MPYQLSFSNFRLKFYMPELHYVYMVSISIQCVSLFEAHAFYLNGRAIAALT